MAQYRVTASAGLNVRTAPATTGNTPIGALAGGAIIDAAPPVDGWHKMQLAAGGALIGSAYCSATYTAPVVVPPIDPPPSTTRRYRIGVHTIADHGAARLALENGAPGVVIMFGHLEAVQLKMAFPDRAIVYRPWLQGPVTPAQAFAALEIGADDPGLWYVGLNEDDNFGSSAEAVAGRAVWDRDLFHMIKDTAPQARYFGGSYSHGAPGGIEDANGPVAAAARGYIPLWNEGMGLDFHNYTKGKRYSDDPPSNAPIIPPVWYEQRHHFWFSTVGLDPTKGGGIIHTETGVEAGAGGYAWANYSDQQFGRHLRNLRDMGREPFALRGTLYPSVEEMGFVFQFGQHNDWEGYDTRRYLPVYRQFWGES